MSEETNHIDGDKPAVPSNLLFNRAFMLGFMVSREGFNGECDYEHCAPSRVEASYESVQEFAVRIEHNDMYRQLRAEAMAQMLNPGHQEATHLVRRTLDGVVQIPNKEA